MQNRFASREKTLFGAAVMGFFMLISRCLGLLRDINTAAVMGLSGSVAMDAFVCAFRIPNAARRFFEEGIFGLTFIPVFAKLLESDPRRAWRLAARYLWYGTLIGFGVTIFFELLIAVCWLTFHPCADGLWWNIFRFASLIFPYLIFVIPAAQASAVLQGLGRFGMAGAMPVLFNLCWLAVLFVVSPIGIYLPFKVPVCTFSLFGYSAASLSQDGRGAALSLTIAGISAVQFLIQYLWILHIGAGKFIFGKKDPLHAAAGQEIRSTLRSVFRKMAPAAVGIFFLQFNMLLATLIAVLFSGNTVPILNVIPGVDALFAGTTGTGSASALYFGERLYEFPLALVGITLGTAFFPLLTRRFLEKDRLGFTEDFSAALRLVGTLAVPAGIGLMVMAEPLARLFFAHGAASPEDSERIAKLTLCFGCGVPAFCFTAFLSRAALAFGELKWPLQTGIRAVFVFLAAALLFVRTWGESGLAAAVDAASWAQALFLFFRMISRFPDFKLGELFGTLRNTLIASAVMAFAIYGERFFFAKIPGSGAFSVFCGIGIDLTTGIVIFALIMGILGGGELVLLRKTRRAGKA